MDYGKFSLIRRSSMALGATILIYVSACGQSAPVMPVVHASFKTATLSVAETQGKVIIAVELAAPAASSVRIPLKFSGTADLDRDFNAPAFVEFAANTKEARLEIEPLADGEAECAESAMIELADADGIQKTVTLNITDQDAPARRLRVGPAPREYATPSAASVEARAGDLVEIAEGAYPGDVAVWRASDLVLCGEGAGAVIDASGKDAEGKGIWVVKGDRVRVENVQFRNAKVADRNGAGIRAEGRDLTVRHCRFERNENGILSGTSQDSTITVEYSVFDHNGAGDGYTHNIYIGNIKRLNLRFSTLRETVVGHNVKSRAAETVLEYNRIMDGNTGTASYQVDLPDGGRALLLGNVIQQGPEAENWTLIAYGAEGTPYANNALYLVSNTVVNDRHSGLMIQSPKGIVCSLMNNLFAGKGDMQCENGKQAGNVKNDASFLDRKKFNYRLTQGAKAIDQGVAVGPVGEYAATPQYELDTDGAVRRRMARGMIDAGAYELVY